MIEIEEFENRKLTKPLAQVARALRRIKLGRHHEREILEIISRGEVIAVSVRDFQRMREIDPDFQHTALETYRAMTADIVKAMPFRRFIAQLRLANGYEFFLVKVINDNQWCFWDFGYYDDGAIGLSARFLVTVPDDCDNPDKYHVHVDDFSPKRDCDDKRIDILMSSLIQDFLLYYHWPSNRVYRPDVPRQSERAGSVSVRSDRFHFIRFDGPRIIAPRPPDRDPDREKREVSPHWRRSHLRTLADGSQIVVRACAVKGGRTASPRVYGSSESLNSSG